MKGEVFLATAGTKPRPVVEISEPELARPLVTHFTTTERRIPTQVEIVNTGLAGADRRCWVHAIEPIDRSRLGSSIGRLDHETLWSLCRSLEIAVGCY